MNEARNIIRSYNELLYDIYRQNELVCLSDNEYKYKDENVIAINNPAVVEAAKNGVIDRLNEICKKLKIDPGTKNPNMMQFEIFVATADVKYRLGTLYLYSPYIVILEDSRGNFRENKHFFYDQTMEDGRFNRELPIVFESIYKFWQRIGDYLCAFFPELLLDLGGQTYFHKPFQHISSKYANLTKSKNFQWLNNFANTEYPAFNKHRKFFVHYSGYDTKYFQRFINSASDEKVIRKLDGERKNWLPYLKAQLDQCNDGYLKLMYFLNELEIRENKNSGFEYQLKS